MKKLLESLSFVEEWVNEIPTRAVVISVVDCNEIDPRTGKPNPDNFVYIKGKKADVNAAISHLVKSFK